MAVKKREKKVEEGVGDIRPEDLVREMTEQIRRDARNLKITVAGEEYDVPDLTLKQYRKAVKVLDNLTAKSKDETVSEDEQLKAGEEFFYQLLKPHHDGLKKADIGDMPLYQFGVDFLTKLKVALFQAPLA